jgi:hypothetical protein
MAKIFISHSSKDKEFAGRLAFDLKELGHNPWLDEWEIKVGECIATKIEENLSNSDYVVLVLTPQSVASGWVDREWKTAYWTEIEQRRILVLPVLLEDCEIPTLLKTKKYADFRKNYAIGLAQLVQPIVPTKLLEESLLIKTGRDDREVSNLIAKVQGKQAPLSQCIAEALSIAQGYSDESLIHFCKNELIGYSSKDFPEDGSLDYRLAEAFTAPLARINPQYWGWGNSPSNMFSYMEQHPDEFYPMKTIVTQPVSILEQRMPLDKEKTFMSWTQPLRDFIPTTDIPNHPVNCYARADIYEKVIESIRTELTKRLLKLLPILAANHESNMKPKDI